MFTIHCPIWRNFKSENNIKKENICIPATVITINTGIRNIIAIFRVFQGDIE